jgi:hypothetical protein
MVRVYAGKDGSIDSVTVGATSYYGVKTTAQLRELLALLEGKDG